MRQSTSLSSRSRIMTSQPNVSPLRQRMIDDMRMRQLSPKTQPTDAHRRGQLQFYGEYAGLADPATFARWLAPLRACEWFVYAKRPFAGPEAVLAYLSRYTHRVAISNQRLLAFDERGVTFRWKDYRVKDGTPGKTRHKTMTLGADEFMRRFLLHVLPGGFHRIRHYGLLANGARKNN